MEIMQVVKQKIPAIIVFKNPLKEVGNRREDERSQKAEPSQQSALPAISYQKETDRLNEQEQYIRHS